MNGHHCYLLVEGQQDVFFVGRLLEELGLRSVRTPQEIPERWHPFIDRLLQQRDEVRRATGRGGVPLWQMFRQACLVSATHSVVVERAEGNRTQFARTLRATDDSLDGGLAGLTAVGIIPDADTDPAAALQSAQAAMTSAGLAVPPTDQDIVTGQPTTGIFVLPGNNQTGGLEEILFDCARTIYPALAQSAHEYVEAVDFESGDYTPEDLREMRTPQGPLKARIGAIASILKPGSTIQTSIHRDRWVCPATMAVPRVKALAAFLQSLCALP